MISYNPKTLISQFSKLNNEKWDPEVHHIIAMLSVLGDNEFKGRGDADVIISALINDGIASFKEATFSNELFPNLWFIWSVGEGIIEIVEGTHPDISDEVVDLDVNDIISFAVEGDLINVIQEIIEGEEIIDGLSWAECVDKLQEFEIYSDDEDLEMMQAFVRAMEMKINNQE